MPDRLTDDEWSELLKERDEFKLAVLGATAIEADVDAAVEAAFAGPVPRELSPTSIRYELRLALAVGLGVIPEEWKPMFTEIAQLRNDFAHGKIRELDAKRARHLVAVTLIGDERVAPDKRTITERLKEAAPRFSLRMCLQAARAVVTKTSAAHQKRQAEEREIVADYRSGLLQTTIVRELARGAENESET